PPHGDPDPRAPPGDDSRAEQRPRSAPRVRRSRRLASARAGVGAADAFAPGARIRRAGGRVVGGHGSGLSSLMTAPAAPRIDAHQHFWRYDPAEYAWID